VWHRRNASPATYSLNFVIHLIQFGRSFPSHQKFALALLRHSAWKLPSYELAFNFRLWARYIFMFPSTSLVRIRVAELVYWVAHELYDRGSIHVGVEFFFSPQRPGRHWGPRGVHPVVLGGKAAAASKLTSAFIHVVSRSSLRSCASTSPHPFMVWDIFEYRDIFTAFYFVRCKRLSSSCSSWVRETDFRHNLNIVL
jgi:hypothetical protein